ncbi:MAG: class II aldolase/adducin family protein [Alphaproteobacteria bacterium]|nr:class II aldolase/adducin family protein [Alphaproteobacteria bacterium]
MKHLRARRGLTAAMAETERRGLNRGTTGNASVRIAGGLLITPSGVPCEGLTPGDMVEMAADGKLRDAAAKPSSEWWFHKDILAHRPEIGAVVHAHSPFATVLAVHAKPIPAFHYMIALAGGSDIRCASYATFGTQALSDAVLRALDGRDACLMANHGLIALGADIGGALALAVEVEALAAMYVHALQLGSPKLLSAVEMRRVRAKFAKYGSQS